VEKARPIAQSRNTESRKGIGVAMLLLPGLSPGPPYCFSIEFFRPTPASPVPLCPPIVFSRVFIFLARSPSPFGPPSVLIRKACAAIERSPLKPARRLSAPFLKPSGV
jgi:hypothetical protein